jgi:hypothetical protein
MRYTKTFTEALKQVREDGHTDVSSAVRQCKTAIEDASQMLSRLQGMNPEDSLPSWWMNKIAIAANSMNKLRDYLLVPSKSVSDPMRDPGAKTFDTDKDKGQKDAKAKENTIDNLKAQIVLLKQRLENERHKTVKPEPNKDTGEVPLRTGVAQAILDKSTPMPKLSGDKKEKVKVGGKTKIEVNPKVDIGIYSGGKQQSTGNLH